MTNARQAKKAALKEAKKAPPDPESLSAQAKKQRHAAREHLLQLGKLTHNFQQMMMTMAFILPCVFVYRALHATSISPASVEILSGVGVAVCGTYTPALSNPSTSARCFWSLTFNYLLALLITGTCVQRQFEDVMPLRIALGIVLVQLVICNSIHGQYEDVSAHGVYIGMCYAARYFIAHLRQTNATARMLLQIRIRLPQIAASGTG